MTLQELSNGKIVCAGYYQNTDAKTVADGAFFMLFDPSSFIFKPIGSGVFPFPAEIINDYRTKPFSLVSSSDATMLAVSLVSNYDGSITLLGENVICGGFNKGAAPREEKCYFDRHIFSAAYDFYAISISSDGHMPWVKKVARNQFTVRLADAKLIGYHTEHYNNSLYIFFLDADENLAVTSGDAKEYKMNTPGFLACVKISSDGSISKTKVQNFDPTDEMRYDVKKFMRISESEIWCTAKRLKAEVPFILNMK